MTTAAYRITIHAARHELSVALSLSGFPSNPITLTTPTWVPGAYGFMKYARDVFDATAVDAQSGAVLTVTRNGWSGYTITGTHVGNVLVQYRVYGYDPAWGELAGLVEHHQAVLLGTRHLHALAHTGPVTVEYALPTGWPIHHPAGARLLDDGRYEYENAAAFVDAPVVCGEYLQHTRRVEGTAFDFLFLDRTVGFDSEIDSFLDALSLVASACRHVFGSFPFARYTFIFSFSPTAHWGLEHANATMIGLDQMVFVDTAARAGAIRVCAHELFHAWNVCRLKPSPLGRLDPVAGSFPNALWIGEGFTRYYEFLLSVRAGAISADQFFSNIVNYYRHLTALPAYQRVTAADSSRATFLNHNRYPGSVNNTTDYYDHGMLIAFDLDATLRLQTPSTLDAEFRAFYDTYVGVGDGITTDDARRFFGERYDSAGELITREVTRPGSLSTLSLLERLGFEVRREEHYEIGLVLDGNSGPVVSNVLDDSPAGASGIAPGDELLTVDGFPFQLRALRWLIARGETMRIEVRRGHRRHTFEMQARARLDVTALLWRGTEAQGLLLHDWLAPISPLAHAPAEFDRTLGRAISLTAYDNFHGIQAII